MVQTSAMVTGHSIVVDVVVGGAAVDVVGGGVGVGVGVVVVVVDVWVVVGGGLFFRLLL